MQPIQTWVGTDVSAKTLTSRLRRKGSEDEREFTNDEAGYRAMLQWCGRRARVCVEATGVYHLQLCLFLRAAGVEVMVVNPRVAKDFARSLNNRSKTDKVDAWTLLEYLQRMAFMPWEPPSEGVLQLRELGRRIKELVQAGVDEKNRLHSKQASRISKVVAADVKGHIAQIERRAKSIEKTALEVIRSEAELNEEYELLVAIRGIGCRSAILLLSELAVLDPTMNVRELVAYAGLDPRVFDSGTSVHRPARISKVGNARLRAILYMVALSAIRYERGPRIFYARLVGRGKKKMQAIVAVMRKMLHGIWIVLQRRVRFDYGVLFAASLAQAESSDSAAAANKPEADQGHPKGRSEAEELRKQLEPDPPQATRRKKIA